VLIHALRRRWSTRRFSTGIEMIGVARSSGMSWPRSPRMRSLDADRA
jgi:hypothetical protein